VEYQDKLQEIEINRIKSTNAYLQGLTTFTDSFTNAFANLKIDIDSTSINEIETKFKEQERGLVDSVKNQTLAYKDFVDKTIELDKQRRDATIEHNKQILTAINDALKEAMQNTLDATKTSLNDTLKQYLNTSNAIISIDNEEKRIKSKNTNELTVQTLEEFNKLNELSANRTALELKQQELTRKAYIDTGIIIGSTFVQMVADGKSAQKAIVMSMLAALKAEIPILVALILGKELATKSVLGIASSAVLTGILMAAVSVAEAAVNSAKFFKGVVNLKGKGTSTSDSIPAKLSKGESVIPASATQKNIKELQYLLNNDKSVINYYKEKEPQTLKRAYMEIATAKDLLSFVPVINLMLEERKVSNQDISTLRKEIAIMSEKLDLLTAINQNIEKGNYSRKMNTTVDLNVEVSDNELIKRIKRQDLMSIRRS